MRRAKSYEIQDCRSEALAFDDRKLSVRIQTEIVKICDITSWKTFRNTLNNRDSSGCSQQNKSFLMSAADTYSDSTDHES